MAKRFFGGVKFGSALRVLLPALCLVVFAQGAAAQRRMPDLGGIGGRVGRDAVDLKLEEITLEAIDFRRQTARLNLGMNVRTPLGVKLKDFDYRLRLFEQEIIEGNYDGSFKVGGRNGSRLNMPVEVNLRSIPGVLWNAFGNRGQVRYDLDAGFTLPLFLFEKRLDQSFSGEVPLRSLVDAASIARARRGGGGAGGILGDILPRW
jgi:hypothetical protein